jgi:hypothetical protein
MSARISRGHALIAAAVLVAGIIVAYVAGPESCDTWSHRYTQSLADVIAGRGTQHTVNIVRAQRPEGC